MKRDVQSGEDAFTSAGEALIALLSAWTDDGRITGFQVVRVRDHDDVLDHDLDEDAILAESGAVFPVVWVNVTFEVGTREPGDFSDLERDYGLQFIGEYAPQG